MTVIRYFRPLAAFSSPPRRQRHSVAIWLQFGGIPPFVSNLSTVAAQFIAYKLDKAEIRAKKDSKTANHETPEKQV